ncbi:flippase [Candidatus Kuenenbacteria bacterium]|nr:flippase [Candidatus Kuenenbacteria bacterium]
MNLTQKIAWNTIIHTIGKFGASAIGVLVVAILTRYLGVEGYGEYTTVFAYLFFFAVLADLGLYVVTINELKRSQWGEERFFNNIFTMRFVSAIFMMALAGALVWFFPYNNNIKWGVLLASLSVALGLIDQTLVAYFQNKINMKMVAAAELAGKILLLILTGLVISRGLGLMAILATVVIGFVLNVGINLVVFLKQAKLKLTFDLIVWREIFGKSWPIAVTSIFSLIYFKADTLLLSILPINPAYALSNSEAVGIYGAPYKILEVLIAWPAIFMGLVGPVLAKAFAEGDLAGFKKAWQKAFDGLAVIIWPMIVGTTILARPIIVLLAGESFAAAGTILKILIWATGIIFLSHLTTYAIIAIGRQKQMIKYYLSAAVIALVLYIILIPKYAYFGAAGVTVGVELFMLMATMILLGKATGLKINLMIFGKAFLAAMVMGMALWLASGWHIVLSIPLGIIIYLIVMFLAGGIDRNLLKK